MSNFIVTANATGTNGHVLISDPLQALIVDDSRPAPFAGPVEVNPSTATGTGTATVKAGATITLRIGNLSNVAFVQFLLPPEGWNGSGSTMTPPISPQGDFAEFPFQIPADAAGKQFKFSAIFSNGRGKTAVRDGPLIVVGN